MEITKVVKPFIRRRCPNTFGNIVYIYTHVNAGESFFQFNGAKNI